MAVMCMLAHSAPYGKADRFSLTVIQSGGGAQLAVRQTRGFGQDLQHQHL